MLQNFKNLEEQIYNSDVDNEAEMTCCNPSEVEEESGNVKLLQLMKVIWKNTKKKFIRKQMGMKPLQKTRSKKNLCNSL